MAYDYIFCGFGLSAVLLLDKLLDAGTLNGKKVLIIDEKGTLPADKTWCFWERGTGKWDGVLAKTWTKAEFKNHGNSKNCLGEGLRYKMIDSKKFFEYINQKIATNSNIEICDEKVVGVTQLDSVASVATAQNNYRGNFVFNSIFDKRNAANSNHPLLLQHFTGWYVKVGKSPFATDTAILMDFAIPQEGSTRFMYVLPLSDSEFLVEFTLFSPAPLPLEAYEVELKAYLKKNGIDDYEIIKTEKGIIPMTAFPFWKLNSRNILHIGSAGGWTKSSTGYTFNSARSKSKKLIKFLAHDRVDFRKFHRTTRFYWYDRLFVEVLFHRNSIGYELFSSLFLKSNPVEVLRFLDEKSSAIEEFKVIMAAPKIPFLKALAKTIMEVLRR